MLKSEIQNNSYGVLLKQAREQKGVSLEEASNDLKIIKSVLEALEKEQTNKLPPFVYLKGIIKKYSQYLNLDSEVILSLYEQQTQGKNSFKLEKQLFRSQQKFFNSKPPKIKLFSLFYFFSHWFFSHFLEKFFLFALLFYILFEICQFILPAQIILFYPPHDFNTHEQKIIIAGKVIRGKILYFQGEEIAFDNKGFFQIPLQLNPGLNTLSFEAFNALGKKTELISKVILLTNE